MFNPANQTHFSLSLDGLRHDLQVLEFSGHEGISRPYRFELELVSERAGLDLEALMHRPAFLAFTPRGQGVHGLVYGAAQADAGKRLTRYRLTLVPHLAYLAQRNNQRIFQHLTVPQIVALILEEHGILADAYRFQLGTRYPEREYCVQYDESDLHFVQRLCAEEGIHFHFRHSAEAHLLVFGDDQTVFPRLGRPTAYVHDSGLVADEPVIKRFSLRLASRTTRTTRRDYDFEKPRLLLGPATAPLPTPRPSRTWRTTTTPVASSIASAASCSASAPWSATAPTGAWAKGSATSRCWSAGTSWRSPSTRARSGTTCGCSAKSSTKASSRRCWKRTLPPTRRPARTTSSRATATASSPRPGRCSSARRWSTRSRACWAARPRW
ncbi:hypothetical protein Q029_02877 [Pseudomonas aeruginosa BWHPSA016]|nr:hypothetical protein Q029_02877 [Pseudomonas aeruginosa BWHPSA016]